MPSPPKLSDLLSAFGATRSPSSVSQNNKMVESKNLRPVKPEFSYAESESTNSPTKSEGSSFDEVSPKSSKTSIKVEDSESEESEEGEDELNAEETIQGKLSLPPCSLDAVTDYPRSGPNPHRNS